MASQYKSIAMEKSAILTADILDIIFEGKNKEYGAYELRRTYNKRLYISISVMLSVILLFLAGYALQGRNKADVKPLFPEDQHLTDITPPEEKVVPPPLPPPTPPEPPKTQTVKFTEFKITKDEDVKPEEKPPVVEELEDTKIGTVNVEGVKDDGITAPPVTTEGKGIIDIPKKEEPNDDIVLHVQIESTYPGGIEAWRRFLTRSLDRNYPQEAIDNHIGGTVVVLFIVDKEGKVSNVEALSGPAELREAAVKVIQKSGKWNPAIQNGRNVKSYKRQPITFQLQDE
jgi:periplasmic protein TonB